MSVPEITSYVASERAKNIPDTTIRANLLANGWADKDIAEAMAVKKAPENNQLKEYRNSLKWTIFFTLVVLDTIIVLGLKLYIGVYGLFGMGLLSTLLRLALIYGIAVFSSRDSSLEENKTKAVAHSVAKVFGTLVLFVVIGAGVAFAGCLFIVAGMK